MIPCDVFVITAARTGYPHLQAFAYEACAALLRDANLCRRALIAARSTDEGLENFDIFLANIFARNDLCEISGAPDEQNESGHFCRTRSNRP